MKRFLFYTFALLAPLFAVAQQSERPQYVVFQVIPKTATVSIGEKSTTTDSDGIAVFTLHDGFYHYTVSSKDHHSASGSFEVSGSKVVKNIELDPAYGWLKVAYYDTEKYNGAKVYVDGILIGEVPITSGKLSSGTHPVRIVHNQYKIFDELVVIEDGTTYEYSPQLTPRMGTINITSTPAMAYVYVDYELVGQTPLMVDAIIGEHNISVRKGRLGADPQNATVSENNTTDVNLVLTERTSSGATYIETASGLNMKMVYVEGGTFQMGATSEQQDSYNNDEKPIHSVTLDSYYIAETEVTQAQWYAIMGTTIYQQRVKASCDSTYGVGDNNPMYYVSWEEAQEFCRRLSELTGKTYTLPTEAQWEFAARGGNQSQGYKYSGSNIVDDVAWHCDNSNNHTHAVKQKLPNELGLYDMSGNVWEWCSDWYGEYSSFDQMNPTGSSPDNYRVGRGDSWYGYWYCRVSARGYNTMSYRNYDVGFRVVCLPHCEATSKPTSATPKQTSTSLFPVSVR